MRHKNNKIIRTVRQIENSISYSLILGLVFLSFMNVVMRYFFDAPIQWAEEILVACFVWLTFWSIGLAYQNVGFIHIDFIDSILSVRFQKFLNVFNDSLIFLFSLIVLYWALKLSIQASVKVTNILRVPYSFINISLFLGFLSLDKEIIFKYVYYKR